MSYMEAVAPDAVSSSLVSDTVVFNVGGQKFEVLERTIRAKGPETLLCTLLDDPARHENNAPIYVEADSERFRYILDWYRYGSIKIPNSMGMEEMKRECAFFQLPEHVDVFCERVLPAHAVTDALSVLQDVRTRARSDASKARLQAIAAALFTELVETDELARTGQSVIGDPPDVREICLHRPVETQEVLRLLNVQADEFGWYVTCTDRSIVAASNQAPQLPAVEFRLACKERPDGANANLPVSNL
mmetsp:Transcript_8786/g.19497  ORF Transcript_8786/g.19497 Transcript_8786/m.19497 type:complete len:246 (-) Transcript_8786:16-753(-)